MQIPTSRRSGKLGDRAKEGILVGLKLESLYGVFSLENGKA